MAGCTLALAIPLAVPAAAMSGNNKATLQSQFAPFTTANNVFTAGSIDLVVTTVDAADPGTASSPTIFPDQMTHLTLRFDHQFRFNTNAAPVCTAGLAGTTTSQAQSICPPGSDVGGGTATFCVNNNGGGCAVFSADATLFNGPTAGHARLHLWSQSPGVTVVSKGTFSTGTSGTPDYVNGPRIDFPFPVFFNIAAITRLELLIHHGGYVRAKCQASDTAWNASATVTYLNGTPADRPNSTQSCFVS
jgi:hypothetical protein